jgi:hypothetical protein
MRDDPLGRSTTRSRRCRGRFLAPAIIALAMPSLHSTIAARQDGQDRASPRDAARAAPRVDDDEQALKEFLQVYRLAPGQILKRVPPPRPAGIRVYSGRKHPGRGNTLDQARALTFLWRDPHDLREGVSLFANDRTARGWPLRDLPRYLNLEIWPVQIEGDPELLKTEVSGDWIIRDGVPDEQVIRPFEAILQRALRRRITLIFRQVERDVVVARGRFRYAPLPGRSDNEIEIYGKSLAEQDGGGGGSGRFSDFLKWVSEWIGRPIVSEVESPPKENVGWHDNQPSPFTEQGRREAHDEALVLRHLQEQTGLTFTRERRPIRILFIERAR